MMWQWSGLKIELSTLHDSLYHSRLHVSDCRRVSQKSKSYTLHDCRHKPSRWNLLYSTPDSWKMGGLDGFPTGKHLPRRPLPVRHRLGLGGRRTTTVFRCPVQYLHVSTMAITTSQYCGRFDVLYDWSLEHLATYSFSSQPDMVECGLDVFHRGTFDADAWTRRTDQ